MDARALTALVQPIDRKELAHVDARRGIGPRVKIDRTGRAPLREVFPDRSRVIAPFHCPEVGSVNAISLYGGSGKARGEKKPRIALAFSGRNRKLRKPDNRNIPHSKGQASS